MSETLRDALRDLRKDVREDIDRALVDTNRRLDGIVDHLATLNGRVGKGEVDQARTDEALKNLGREVFRRRTDDRQEDPAPEHGADPAKRAISERDIKIVLATLLAVGGTITFVQKVWPALAALVKAAGP